MRTLREWSQRSLEEVAAGPALVPRVNALHANVASGQEVLAAATGGNPVAARIVRDAIFRYVTDLGMRRKEHRVVVAVWDPVSGTVMSSSVEVSP